MRKLVAGDKAFQDDIQRLRAFDLLEDEVLDKKVSQILANVKEKGNEALLGYIKEFDRIKINFVQDAMIDPELFASSWKRLSSKERDVLSLAVDRIHSFHQHQIERSWSFRDEDNNRLGQQVSAIKRVGVYVPGGRASYPSTSLMTVIPAQVAGVSEIAVVTPIDMSQENDFLFAAFHKLGIEEVYGFGGAQSIAALAFGTETIEKVVSKISRELEEKIREIIKEEIAKSREKNSNYSLTPEALALSSEFMNNKGKLPWPLEKGIIVGRYGTQKHVVFSGVETFNNGVDIATDKNADVRVVFDGTVSRIFFIKGEGKAVLINHGEYFSVYSGLKEVGVKTGEKLLSKEKIGVVTTHKEDDKTELHFEIWKGYDKQNPSNWLYNAY